MVQEKDRQLTKISPEAQSSQQRNSTESTEISAILSKLALHYWRPGFSPSQVKLLLGDFLNDLQGYSAKDIAWACATYRQNPENQFYPTSGQLLGILRKYETSGPSLPTYKPPQIEQRYGKLKPVAEILREHGFSTAKWEKT